MASNDEENRLIAERRQKLANLRENGVAFPNTFRRTALAAELHAAYQSHDAEALRSEAIEVSVAGRMLAKRVMGKNSFVRIQDRSGHIQLFVQRDQLGQDVPVHFIGHGFGAAVPEGAAA